MKTKNRALWTVLRQAHPGALAAGCALLLAVRTVHVQWRAVHKPADCEAADDENPEATPGPEAFASERTGKAVADAQPPDPSIQPSRQNEERVGSARAGNSLHLGYLSLEQEPVPATDAWPGGSDAGAPKGVGAFNERAAGVGNFSPEGKRMSREVARAVGSSPGGAQPGVGALLPPSGAGSLPAPRAIEVPGDGSYSESGFSVALSRNTGLVGATYAMVGTSTKGAAYVYRNLDTASGTVNQNAKLTASDGVAYGQFGYAVSLSGNTGLVGGGTNGAAYVYRNLDTATGTVTENAKLTTNDTTLSTFGNAVSLSGSTGLVGAPDAMVGGNYQGAAYVFRNLDTASGTVTQNVRLTSSDGAAGGGFGEAISLSGNTGLVGAEAATVGSTNDQGAAYVFRNLDTATGTVTQNVKLTSSDGVAGSGFGAAVSLSGNIGLITGSFGTNLQHAAYVFRNLDTATGTVTENAKLTASDYATGNGFGAATSLSGSTALVGATLSNYNTQPGSVYVFRNLDTATGTVTENVKLTASDGLVGDRFGAAVSVDGDLFLIGAPAVGKSYSGTVSSVTTLDTGNATGLINGISFVSRNDWIIGQTTSANQVTLSKGDTANVTATGKGVYVGENAGSNNNTLLVQGTVLANTVTVSSATGSAGNTLQIANDGGTTTAGTVTATTGGIVLNAGGMLLLSGSASVTDRIGNTTALTLQGGSKFSTGGLSEGTAPTAAGGSGGIVGVGTLTLTGTSSASRAGVDFGNTAAGSALVFSSLAAGGKGSFVSIIDWTGTVGVDNGASTNDRILFATDPGYTRTDLAHWQFSNDAGTNYGQGAQEIAYDGFFEIVPVVVPEPATWALLGLGGAGLLGLTARQRRCGRPA